MNPKCCWALTVTLSRKMHPELECRELNRAHSKIGDCVTVIWWEVCSMEWQWVKQWLDLCMSFCVIMMTDNECVVVEFNSLTLNWLTTPSAVHTLRTNRCTLWCIPAIVMWFVVLAFWHICNCILWHKDIQSVFEWLSAVFSVIVCQLTFDPSHTVLGCDCCGLPCYTLHVLHVVCPSHVSTHSSITKSNN